MAITHAKRRQLSEELIERAAAGRHQDVSRLLEEGADTDFADRNGYTAVSEAAMAGQTVVLGQLLRAGADPNKAAKDGRTPLHRAAFHGWMPALRLLLENGADPNQKDSDGKTPAEVSKRAAVQELFVSFTEEQIQEAMEAQKRKMAQRPCYGDEDASLSQPAQANEAEIPKKTSRTPKTIYYKDVAKSQTNTDQGAAEGEKQFLELHPTLDIIAQPDGYASRPGDMGGYKDDVKLQNGSLIVETSDGLFASDEVGQQVSESPEQQAALWLQKLGDAPEVALDMKAIQDAKASAQEHFNQGNVGTARQVTTAAIRAAELLLAREASLEEKVNEDLQSLLGVLRSNRSLLLTHQIQAGDTEVLQFGADAAWSLVVKDTDAALMDNPSNFKASFRRARALFELGELDQAMADATRVVDHYARNTQVSNPEAVALRQSIMDALKKERAKWGDKGGPRWNRLVNDSGALISEVS
ncbi:Iqank1 [Symbiodinium natans]|uniref:Iqank1 protein n=1 Tax=Symbiodinium natans TaxID=878477 RepID=A0A812IC17_9DINO|nr:Iqank1 [Symbiodinium natans]